MPHDIHTKFFQNINKGTELKELNDELLNVPMAFKYYSNLDTEGLYSECILHNNSCLRRYLLTIISSKLSYISEQQLFNFTSNDNKTL